MWQQQERGQGQQGGRNPLVGECAADTIANCHDLVEYLQLSDEDLHPGMRLNLQALRDALGGLKAPSDGDRDRGGKKI